jgi:hypothetical protein
MARLNTKKASEPIYTHGDGKAIKITPREQLRRLCLATMLWEDQFYVDGKSTADLISETIKMCKPVEVAGLALEAREKQKLRHLPLLLVRELARMKNVPVGLIRHTLSAVIQRVDEITEFVAIYWKDGKIPLSAQIKKGLADAFNKFNAYQFAKYDRETTIKLRDVAFLVHPNPKDKEHAEIFARLLNKDRIPEDVQTETGLTEYQPLDAPATWEVAQSAGTAKKTDAQKKDEWTRLLSDKKLGGLALIRNLRNMLQAGVDENLIREALTTMKADRVLPFRFLTAARYNKRLEDALEGAMLKCLATQEKLPGKTILIVDVSGSMYSGAISAKSELTRVDAAGALALMIREISEHPVIYATAGSDYARKHQTELVPPRRGFGLSELITDSNQLCRKLGGGGIFLTQVMDYVIAHEKSADRIIVITDEQDCETDPAKSADKANAFGTHNYLINIAAYKNGIEYKNWLHIDGWSEAVIDFIRSEESPETDWTSQLAS